MEQYFGIARELLEKGIAKKEETYGEDNLYDLNITDTEDILFYKTLAEGIDGKILDIGCGTGRILKPLLEGGHTVFGLDLSEHMLEITNEKLKTSNLMAPLFQGDMKDFQIRHKFALIMIPNCSMIYIDNDEDRKRVFKSVYQHLDEGGVFVFDFDTEVVIVEETKPWLSSQAIHPLTGETILSTVQIKGLHNHLRLMNMVNYRIDKKGQARVSVNSSYEATCTFEKMNQLLLEEGFKVKEVYCDYIGTSYEGGEHCVIIAEKA